MVTGTPRDFEIVSSICRLGAPLQKMGEEDGHAVGQLPLFAIAHVSISSAGRSMSSLSKSRSRKAWGNGAGCNLTPRICNLSSLAMGVSDEQAARASYEKDVIL